MHSYNQRIASKLRTSYSMSCMSTPTTTTHLTNENKINRKHLAAQQDSSKSRLKTKSEADLTCGHVFWNNSTTGQKITNKWSSSGVGHQSGLTNDNKKRTKYKIKRENMALYFAYEYVMFGLVLDRLFFWFYFLSTLLSYFITLYVFPFVMQTNKKEELNNANVP